MSVAQLTAVTKRFGPVTALDRLTLAVPAGEVLALLGPNGAGKSTSIALLLGLRVPDAGSVRLFGADPRRPAARRHVGFAPQETSFPPTLRVSELLAFVRAHYQRVPPLAALTERFDLGPLWRRQLGGLSGGERRLVAVAAAFAGDPAFVVLDEPTSGLDREARLRVWDAIRAHERAGGAVLLTTHQLGEAEALARRVVLLEAGAVVADGGVAEIRSAAGLTRVSFLRAGERVQVDVRDGGAFVESLVRGGVRLAELEVRPLTLEEALDARRRARCG
jgi:ABC-2 type transport system ATP-binding protein